MLNYIALIVNKISNVFKVAMYLIFPPLITILCHWTIIGWGLWVAFLILGFGSALHSSCFFMLYYLHFLVISWSNACWCLSDIPILFAPLWWAHSACISYSVRCLFIDPRNQAAIHCIRRVLALRPSLDFLLEKLLERYPDILSHATVSEEAKASVRCGISLYLFPSFNVVVYLNFAILIVTDHLECIYLFNVTSVVEGVMYFYQMVFAYMRVSLKQSLLLKAQNCVNLSLNATMGLSMSEIAFYGLVF